MDAVNVEKAFGAEGSGCNAYMLLYKRAGFKYAVWFVLQWTGNKTFTGKLLPVFWISCCFHWIILCHLIQQQSGSCGSPRIHLFNCRGVTSLFFPWHILALVTQRARPVQWLPSTSISCSFLLLLFFAFSLFSLLSTHTPCSYNW